jgi:hypothetical protein
MSELGKLIRFMAANNRLDSARSNLEQWKDAYANCEAKLREAWDDLSPAQQRALNQEFGVEAGTKAEQEQRG